MKHVSEIFVSNDRKISISSLKELQQLPDKSILVLYNNLNYIEVIYLYVLYKLDMYLEENLYTEDDREKYFNICFDIIPTLICCQNRFLAGGHLCLDKVFDNVPKEIKAQHERSLKMIITFFFGVLSSTAYLKNKLFLKEKLLFTKHNCSYILSALDAEVTDF